MTNYDFSKLSLEELRSVRDQIESNISDAIIRRRAALVKELKELESIEVPKPNNRRRSKAPILYRDSANNSWSGFGRLPAWLKQHEAAGGSREDFRVKGL